MSVLINADNFEDENRDAKEEEIEELVNYKRHCNDSRSRWSSFHYSLLEADYNGGNNSIHDPDDIFITSPNNTPVRAEDDLLNSSYHDYCLPEIFINDSIKVLPALRDNIFRSISMDLSEQTELIHLHEQSNRVVYNEEIEQSSSNIRKRKFHDIILKK